MLHVSQLFGNKSHLHAQQLSCKLRGALQCTSLTLWRPAGSGVHTLAPSATC